MGDGRICFPGCHHKIYPKVRNILRHQNMCLKIRTIPMTLPKSGQSLINRLKTEIRPKIIIEHVLFLFALR